MLEYLSEASPTLRQKDCASGPIEKIPAPVYQYLPRVLYRKRRDSNISKPPLPSYEYCQRVLLDCSGVRTNCTQTEAPEDTGMRLSRISLQSGSHHTAR